MKSAFLWISSIILSLLVGLASVIFAIGVIAQDNDSSHAGQWFSSVPADKSKTGPYLRAILAMRGGLAMPSEEALYFTSIKDSEGNAYDGNCTYHLEGGAVPSRWWSITAYNIYSDLIDNPDNRYSVTKTSVIRKEDGSYVTVISPSKQEGNWIAVKKGQPFELTARLYHPDASALKAPEKISLPKITKKACS
ncbi:MAG: DUF1214 domain-containing protein [Methyloligellaceae bacterium]